MLAVGPPHPHRRRQNEAGRGAEAANSPSTLWVWLCWTRLMQQRPHAGLELEEEEARGRFPEGRR